MLQNLLADTVYLVDTVEPVVIWLSVGIVAALVVAGIVLYLVKKDILNAYVKWAIFGFLVYSLVIGILMVVLEIVKHYSVDYATENWLDREAILSYVLVPMLVLLAVVLASVLAVCAAKKFLPAAFKPTIITCGVLSVAALIMAAVFMGIYFATTIEDNGYYDGGYGEVNQVALYVGAAALIIVAVAMAFLFDKGKKGFDTRSIAYAAVCIAMSFALSYVKLFTMPQGGSVTFVSLLPLMVYSYMFGTKKGVFAGFIYGILQAVQDPWIIHPAQFLLDYPIAFSFIGLAGMFANFKPLKKYPQAKFALGAVVASVFRYAAHVLSGVFAFSAYALDKGFDSAWIYSLAYNSFVFIDIIFVIIAGVLVFSSESFNKQVDTYRLSELKKEN